MTATHSSDEPPAHARQLAFDVLERYRSTGEFAVRLLETELGRSQLPPAERRLATELVAGIVRRRLTLDTVIQTQVSRPRQRVEPALWTLLQLGAYQLLFLDGIPVHAAVHETVELAKGLGQPRWCGFLNGVLRSIAGLVTGESGETPATDTLPMRGHAYLRLAAPVFSDPSGEPAAWFSQAFSFPRWLADRWLPRFGFGELCRLGFWFNEPHGVTLRVNALQTGRDALLTKLNEAAVDAQPGQHPLSVRLERSTDIARLPGFADGWFTPQDESAMRAADWLDPQPGDRVLDLCAAPGTKSTHIAELMQNAGSVVAADTKAARLRRVAENSARLGLASIETRLIPADADTPVEATAFDAVLVDVPCSNTGVLGKRPEVRWRIQSRDLVELAQLQLRLLSLGAEAVKPGGRLLYSTCSIEPEENESLVASLLERRSDMLLEKQQTSIPGQPHDGGFLALFRRAG